MKPFVAVLLFFVAVFAVIFLIAEPFSPFYKIEQTVESRTSLQSYQFQMGWFGDIKKQPTADYEKYGDLVINTYVWHKGDILKSWSDMANDTIKCYRYNQARNFIKIVKALNKPCK